MPLNLYRRHFRTARKCLAGYPPDFRNYETDELRRGWKRCHCPIYAAGTISGRFHRKNTKRITWAEAKGYVVIDQWGPIDVREFRSTWPVSPVTAAKNMSNLKAFFEFAVSNEWIARNPARLVKNPRGRASSDARHQERCPFSDEEL